MKSMQFAQICQWTMNICMYNELHLSQTHTHLKLCMLGKAENTDMRASCKSSIFQPFLTCIPSLNTLQGNKWSSALLRETVFSFVTLAANPREAVSRPRGVNGLIICKKSLVHGNQKVELIINRNENNATLH